MPTRALDQNLEAVGAELKRKYDVALAEVCRYSKRQKKNTPEQEEDTMEDQEQNEVTDKYVLTEKKFLVAFLCCSLIRCHCAAQI